MKIPTKPIANPEKVTRARDMSGLQKWSRESRVVSFFMLVLGWFTIPAEVYLRRNFGRRWFTITNFYAGAFLLLFLTSLQFALDKITNVVAQFESALNPFYSGRPQGYILTNNFITLTVIYVIMGMYHLFRIWWKRKTNTELHSYDDGTSWLEFFGRIIMAILNFFAWPLIYLYMESLSEEERKATRQPRLITDRTAFTNTILEPLFFLSMATYNPYSIESIWFTITAFAVAIHANQKETSKQRKVLDLQDSMLEAQAMRELRDKAMATNVKPASKQKDTKTKQSSLQSTSHAPMRYPDLITIIEELNKERSHLAK